MTSVLGGEYIGLKRGQFPPAPDGAHKHDTDKNRLELLAPEFVEGVGSVLTFGAKKYTKHDDAGNVVYSGAGNWAKGMKWSRPFGAALRHLWAWARGERCDPESGLPHLYHAGCCIMFLAVYEERSIGQDDRKDIGLVP